MVYNIKFDFPNLPLGGEIDITGIEAIFENGKEYRVSEEAAELFRLNNQRPVVSTDSKPGAVEYEPGPTLQEAFQDNPYVTVTVDKAPQREVDK